MQIVHLWLMMKAGYCYFLDSCYSEFVLMVECTYCKSLWIKVSAK